MKNKYTLLFIIFHVLPYLVIFAFFCLIVYIFANDGFEFEKKQILAEAYEEYEGTVKDMYHIKGDFIEVYAEDTVIVRGGVDDNLIITAEIGDSIYKLKGVNECIIVNGKTKKRYLVPYFGSYRGVLDTITFPRDRGILKKYPGMEVVNLTEKEKEERLKKKNIRRLYKRPG